MIRLRLREAGNSRGRWGNGGVVGSGQEASGSQAGASSIRAPPTTTPYPSPRGTSSVTPTSGQSPHSARKVQAGARDPKDNTHPRSTVTPRSGACCLILKGEDTPTSGFWGGPRWDRTSPVCGRCRYHPSLGGGRCRKWGKATTVTLPTSVTQGSPRETPRARHPEGTPQPPPSQAQWGPKPGPRHPARVPRTACPNFQHALLSSTASPTSGASGVH